MAPTARKTKARTVGEVISSCQAELRASASAWSLALASRLGREGASAQPSAQELGEGRRLAQQVDEAWQDVRDRSVWEG